jgi:hypothetical protein
MSDSTLNLTFTKLRIRVAEFLGIAYYGATGTEAAQLPVDAHDLDLVGRLVNDGYARFLNDNEKGWRFLTVPLTITFGTGTVAADNSRYYLPDDSEGIIRGPFIYPSTGPFIRIDEVTETRIRELQSVGTATTGDPSVYAIRAINTTASATGQRWEAIFWPTPVGTQAVTAIYKRFPLALSGASDVSVAGPIHDRSVLAAALAAAELQREDKIGPREAAYQQALTASRKLDDRSAPSSLGDYGDKSEEGDGHVRRFDMTYNGTTILP